MESSRPRLKVALVTGAGSGIGRACALALHAAGFSVVLAGRRREPLEAAAAALPAEEVLVHPADVSDEAQVAVECLKKGAADYLVKPIHPDTLKLSIDRTLTQRLSAAIPASLCGAVVGAGTHGRAV